MSTESPRRFHGASYVVLVSVIHQRHLSFFTSMELPLPLWQKTRQMGVPLVKDPSHAGRAGLESYDAAEKPHAQIAHLAAFGARWIILLAFLRELLLL